MKATELISRLQEQIKKSGDLDVYLSVNDEYLNESKTISESIEEVSYYEDRKQPPTFEDRKIIIIKDDW